jgi:hypothetical protein
MVEVVVLLLLLLLLLLTVVVVVVVVVVVAIVRSHDSIVVKALYASRWKVAGSRPDEVNEFFSIYLILQAALVPGFYSASNRMFLGSRAQPVRRADSLTAICEPII